MHLIASLSSELWKFCALESGEAVEQIGVYPQPRTSEEQPTE